MPVYWLYNSFDNLVLISDVISITCVKVVVILSSPSNYSEHNDEMLACESLILDKNTDLSYNVISNNFR